MRLQFTTGLLLATCFLIGGCSPSVVERDQSRHVALQHLEAELASSQDYVSPLAERIDATLARELSDRQLDARVNAAWQIMHGIICYGQQLPLQTEEDGQVAALDFALNGGQIHGFEITLAETPLPTTGRQGILARLEPGSYIGQGHPDQWLAIFAMAGIPLETEVRVGEQTATLLDWARQAQYDIPNNMVDEFSWTLIALTHYFPNEPQWPVRGGGMLSWEQLVEAELIYDNLDASPCGGTHRLAGLVRAVQAKQRLGLPDSDVWQRAESTIDSCIDSVKQHRGSNGALSSYYFVRPSQSADLVAELASSGHLFEFLALALPQAELKEPWVALSATRLCDILDATTAVDLDCGALYHALHGLKIYGERIQSGDTKDTTPHP
ncbi:MAG: hypothetical protein R3C53_03850 [Pirellulaceae bacterium]